MTGSAGEPGGRVFVYGTLRSGGGAAGLLRDCRCLGTARVRGALFDIDGRYPAVVVGGEGWVEGEVWECPPGRLDRLDEYEGVAEGLFRRERIEVDGEWCWIYAAGALLKPRLTPEREVAAGRWPPLSRQ